MIDNNSIAWLLRTFDRMYMNCINLQLDKHGLKDVSNPRILFILRYEMEDMKASQNEIGDAIGISPSTVAISIKRMEKAGILCKLQDKNDLRRNVITLTEKGIKFLDEVSDLFDKIDENVFNGFSKSELDQLKKFYFRMICNLESMGAKKPTMLLENYRGDI